MVACETATKTGMVMIFGEITTKAVRARARAGGAQPRVAVATSTVRRLPAAAALQVINYEEVVRKAIAHIGYDDPAKGFDYKTCNVIVAIEEQSPDIAQGVHVGRAPEDIGAGDQVRPGVCSRMRCVRQIERHAPQVIAC